MDASGRHAVVTETLLFLAWRRVTPSHAVAAWPDVQVVAQVGVQGQGGILSLSSAMPKYQDRYKLVFKRRGSLLGSVRCVSCHKDP